MNELTLFDSATEPTPDPVNDRYPLTIPDDLTIIREIVDIDADPIYSDYESAAEKWINKTYLHKLDMGDYSQKELDDYDKMIIDLFQSVSTTLREAHASIQMEPDTDYVSEIHYWYAIHAPIHGRKYISYREFKIIFKNK